MTARRGLGLLAVCVVLLAACTGVPSTSKPQVVTRVGGPQASTPPAIVPVPGADPRSIVSEFLVASATDDLHHAAAHGFLTSEALQRWSDTTVTVVDNTQVSNFANGSVVVTGRKIGSISASGIYTPVQQGAGSGGDRAPFPFVMKQVNGQWRIDNLLNGIIVDDSDFQRLWQQRTLYFFDLAEKHVVADLRYTAISDPALLANWLIGQLAGGPRPELQTSVRIELPAQTDSGAVRVVLGSPAHIQVPGAAQLDPSTRNRLAAQIALTLQPALSGELSIVDAGHTVTVPEVGGSTFTAGSFAAVLSSSLTVPQLYYLSGGHLVDVDGKVVPGKANGQYELTSVAVTSAAAGDLDVAGTAGAGSRSRLYIGTQGNGLRPTPVTGVLSRPAWAPGQSEVWIGAGPSVVRVPVGATGSPGAPVQVPVTSSAGAALGRVVAVRFSPEGTRVALVLTGADGTGQLWVGSVVRGANNSAVDIDGLNPISPQGVSVVDVAWNGRLTLFVVGHDTTTGEPGVFEVQVDGSLWTPRGNANLPGAADSITVAENEVAWVSTGPTVWEQRAGSWASPQPGSTPGTAPVYVE